MLQNQTSETAIKSENLRRRDMVVFRYGFARQILQNHRKAQAKADKLKQYMNAALVAAYECGRLLTEQKALLGKKGNFDKWCQKHLTQISRRTIYNYKALFEQVSEYLKLAESDPAKVQTLALSELNFPSLRQMYVAFGILPDHEQNGEPKPDRSFLEPLLKVL